MKTSPEQTRLPEAVESCLATAGISTRDILGSEPLAGDGSDRLFHRIVIGRRESIIAVIPARGEKGQSEARAAFHIGSHLLGRDVPVPRIHGFDQTSGILLCEDLGDNRLHEVQAAAAPEERNTLYHRAVEILAHMQCAGGHGFDSDWCWDTPRYDRALMIERESGYFLKAFCRDFMAIDSFENGLQEECASLADRASMEGTDYFLHRDFQSRNLMVKDGEIRVIDFQGGRRGPLAYDLASLLIDPYAALAGDLQEDITTRYLDCLEKYLPGLDRKAFLAGYYYLALQRTLQILGAFAFLSQKKNKPFFRAHIRPALLLLHEQLAMERGDDYPCLKGITARCLHLYDNRFPR